MDQRRFRSLGVAAVLAITLGLNARALIAAFFGDYSPEYVLMRYVAALIVGYVGMRFMESILFRPKKKRAVDQDDHSPGSGAGLGMTPGSGTGKLSDSEGTVS